MKTVLITGFEPFGDSTVNPTQQVIERLKSETIEGVKIVTCLVPVVRYKLINRVCDMIEQHVPDVVITLGQATGRAAITPERVAINLDDFRIEDNEGNQPIDEPILIQGDSAYFSTLPIKAITESLTEAGIPCQVSNSAGTFVCNHLFYGVQHYLGKRNIKHGFIHVPQLPEQAVENGLASMSLDDMVKGIKLAALTAIEFEQDLKKIGGEIC